MTALMAKGDPLTHTNHHEMLPSSTKTTKALVVLNRFHHTAPFSMKSTCHTVAMAENYIKNPMLDNNPCNKHHGTKQLVNLVAIHHKIEYHMAHWDYMFAALVTAINGHQEMQPLDCNMQLISNAAMHNAPQPMMITTMPTAAMMSPYITKHPLPVTPDQMSEWCNNGKLAFSTMFTMQPTQTAMKMMKTMMMTSLLQQSAHHH